MAKLPYRPFPINANTIPEYKIKFNCGHVLVCGWLLFFFFFNKPYPLNIFKVKYQEKTMFICR